jgi:hypothetical protein
LAAEYVSPCSAFAMPLALFNSKVQRTGIMVEKHQKISFINYEKT